MKIIRLAAKRWKLVLFILIVLGGILFFVFRNSNKEIKTTEMVVRYRLKNLIKKGIIIGFKPFLNVHKLGYTYFKLHLTLQNLTPEKKKSIVNYIHQHPNTVHMTELVGGADLEAEFQVKTNEEFYAHVQELRLKFGDIIRDYEFMQYTQEYKFTYLPEMF